MNPRVQPGTTDTLTRFLPRRNFVFDITAGSAAHYRMTNEIPHPGTESWLVLCAFVMGLWALAGTDVQAQEFGRLQEMREQTNVAYFYHAQPGDATVQVQVWGTVPRPGIYEVPDTTDLGKLLTMAGGAPLEPRPESQDRPEITVRLYRPTDAGQALLFESPIEQMLSGEKHFRNMQDNDVLVVETVEQRDFTWRDVLSFSGTALSLGLLVVRIIDIRN